MKLVLLFNLLQISKSNAEVVLSDRFLFKVLDQTISLQDVRFQLRNLKALNCIYEDSLLIQFFKLNFITQMEEFISQFPEEDEKALKYLQSKEEVLKWFRYFFKMLIYSKEQKIEISTNLKELISQSAKENKCGINIFHKDSLKTNFIFLLQMEIYLRNRYGGQLKPGTSFDLIRPSIEIFVESLDKQFSHEYFW